MCALLSFGGFAVLAVERGEPVELTPRVLSIYVREAVARVLFALMWPFGWFNQTPHPGSATAPRGVFRRLAGTP